MVTKAIETAADETVRRPRQNSEGSRRADRVREVILDVALDSFSALGFAGTSTRSIAKQAGVQHSLVNYHFQNKENLWIAAMDRVIGPMMRQVHERLADTADASASERFRTFIEVYSKIVATSPQVFIILTQHSTQSTERLDWLMDRFLRAQGEEITAMIAEGQAEGRVIDGDPQHIFNFVMGAIGTFFASTGGYAKLTGRNPSSAAEMHRLIAFICSVVFKQD